MEDSALNWDKSPRDAMHFAGKFGLASARDAWQSRTYLRFHLPEDGIGYYEQQRIRVNQTWCAKTARFLVCTESGFQLKKDVMRQSKFSGVILPLRKQGATLRNICLRH